MSLRVLTLNLWHDAGPYPERARRIRYWLERLDPDLIGCQEVLRGRERDQLAELTAGLGYHLDFARTCEFWIRDSPFAPCDFGNAVASRWPIESRAELALPHGGDGERRTALSVTVSSPLGPLSLTCTHLDHPFRAGEVRQRQVVALCELVMSRRPRSGFPPLLVGDFNAEPDSDEIRFLTGRASLQGRSRALLDAWRIAGSGGDGLTWSNRNPFAASALEPDRRIDYVFAGLPLRSGVGRLESCRVVCDRAADGVFPSDHFGVLAELRSEPLPGREGASGLAGGDELGSLVG